MKTMLDDLLALPELRECRLLCSDVDCHRVVESVTIMDNLHILRWLTNHEILFSNGSSMVDFTVEQWCVFFDGLMAKQTAALFIKLSYYVACIPDEAIEYSRDIGLPVVVVPNSYSWVRISNPIQRYMIDQQSYRLNESLHLRDRLDFLLMKGCSLEKLCREAAVGICAGIAVFDEAGTMLAGEADAQAPWAEVSLALKQHPLFVGGTPAKIHHECVYTFVFKTSRVYLFRLPNRSSTLYSAFWQIYSRTLGDASAAEPDPFKAEQIGAALMICLGRENELRKLERHYSFSFLSDLVDGLLGDAADINARAERLGLAVRDAYQLVVVNFERVDADQVQENLLALLGRSSQAAVHETLVYVRGEQMIAFLPFSCTEDRAAIETLCRLIKHTVKPRDGRFGVSRPHPIQEVPQAFDEALFALSVGRLAGDTIVYYDDLGLLRLFSESASHAKASYIAEHYERTIAPLARYDKENGSDLVETLEALLENDHSIATTAKVLFLHENTLRARIKRIEQVTGCSLKSTAGMVRLAIGMQIHFFMKPHRVPASSGVRQTGSGSVG